MMDTQQTCDVALKEWAVTCRALEEGRQIVLLRKGGILDEDGVFQLEHTAFWLQPTYEHQDERLVKPGHRDLFTAVRETRAQGENKKFILLQLFAVVERVFSLTLDDEDRLRNAPHIWSDAYLDIRYDYKPQHPLLCVAMRVYAREEVHMVPGRPEFFGCRSWIALETPLDCAGARPVLDDATFAERLRELEQVLV
jgi:hypothetical protein